MKATCYLRVGKTARGIIFNATRKPSVSPLNSGSYGHDVPTRQFKLVLNLPDDLFKGYDGEIRVDVPPEALEAVASAEPVE